MPSHVDTGDELSLAISYTRFLDTRKSSATSGASSKRIGLSPLMPSARYHMPSASQLSRVGFVDASLALGYNLARGDEEEGSGGGLPRPKRW